MPKKMFVTLRTGYVGMDSHEVIEYPDDMSDEDIDMDAYYQAIQHAQSYGIEICGEEYCEDPDCPDEHEGSHSIEGHAVPYVPEKHDMYLL